jgi:hypothetical protein
MEETIKTNILPVVLVFLLFTPLLMAQEARESISSSEPAAPPLAPVKSATSLSVSASSLPEAEVALIQSWTFPFLQGESPLTKNNNVKLGASFELTPVSMFGVGDITWTPVAFLQVIAGGRIGSGWNIPLFGKNLRGVGVNHRNADGSTSVIGSAFDGAIWNVRLAGLFQFDFAAISPGEWHHVVFQTQHRIHYDAYSAASKTDSWYTINDAGENRNGFAYYSNFLLGYQMPIFLDTIGFLAELDQYLYNTSGGDNWGDNLGRWKFSLLGSFTVTDWFGLALLAQFQTMRNFTDATKDAPFYQDRQLTDSYPKRSLEFYRIALVANFKIR